MTIKKNINNTAADVLLKEGQSKAIDKKLNELVILLSKTSINPEKADDLRRHLNLVIKNAAERSVEEKAKDDFGILLSNAAGTPEFLQFGLKAGSMTQSILVITSIIVIIFGLGMIIMPAPPFFEMFTIFYFTHNYGITVVDIVSLVIVLIGVYFLIKGIYKTPLLKKTTGISYAFKTKSF